MLHVDKSTCRENEAPRYLVRDRDRVYGASVMHRLRAMGIRSGPPSFPTNLCHTVA